MQVGGIDSAAKFKLRLGQPSSSHNSWCTWCISDG